MISSYMRVWYFVGLNSPRIPLESQSYAQIIINSNDNAHGVLELSALTVTVSEGDTVPALFLSRKGGTFGEVNPNVS